MIKVVKFAKNRPKMAKIDDFYRFWGIFGPSELLRVTLLVKFSYYPTKYVVWAIYLTNKNYGNFNSYFSTRISKFQILVKLSFENGPPWPPGGTPRIFFFEKKCETLIKIFSRKKFSKKSIFKSFAYEKLKGGGEKYCWKG